MKLQTPTVTIKKFQDMSLSSALLRALEKMKISKPTPVQTQALPIGISGGDLIAIAETGSGKTLAFALAILTLLEKSAEKRALILAPSREMAQQIHKVLVELCAETPMTMLLVIGGIPSARQISGLKKNPRIIVGTPGRLNDHLLTNKLLLQNVEIVVIDEADRMLDMGFAPQLKNINSTMRGARQTLMFSASFGGQVETIAQMFMHDKAFMVRTEQAESPVEGLKQKVLLIDRLQKDDRLLDELNATEGGVIIFAGNQHSCERLGNYLKEYGYKVDFIHGGLSQGNRNRVVREFRSAQLRIMVTTDLLARGLDVPHVDHVISFDLPYQAEDFLHRIGRTARAGRSGHAITFVTDADTRMYDQLKPYLKGAVEVKVDKDFKFQVRPVKPAHHARGERVDKYKSKASAKSAGGTSKANAVKGGKPLSNFESKFKSKPTSKSVSRAQNPRSKTSGLQSKYSK
ncbi:MAG: DEAD/DEAH box helicase [Bdellovibrionaceae bacterium]|nr:DEAD/DEAH box helicase [Bdellovibrio sp.]